MDLSTGTKGNWKKWLCTGMTVVLLFQTAGCGLSRGGDAQGSDVQGSAAQSVESLPVESQAVSEQAETGNENGEPSGETTETPKKNSEAISDFYDYVNADWIKEQEEQNQVAYSILIPRIKW